MHWRIFFVQFLDAVFNGVYTDEILLLYGIKKLVLSSYFAAQALCGVHLRNYRRTVCITYKARGYEGGKAMCDSI